MKLYVEEVEQAIAKLSLIEKRFNKVYHYHKLEKDAAAKEINLVQNVLKKVLDIGLPVKQGSLFEEEPWLT